MDDDDAEPSDPELVCAATPGGDGAAAGVVQLVSSGALDRDALAERIVGMPGVGGHGGHGELGDDGLDGATAAASEVFDVTAYPDYVFDASMVEPDARIEITATGENVISLVDAGDPPVIAVAELVVRSGATLAISCDVRIVAAHVLVEQGGTLALQSRNEGACTFAIGSVERGPGLRGGIATIASASFELHGTIDLSGSDGAPASPGGAGGGLTVLAETIVLGDTAVIDVSGGAGGDGVDEDEC
ncbi:MAG TPA: hypothetical protein VG755_05025 [Nannocystaceae bacterium]|nr:hypothetical protein [Nannocystaceae bacterium]